MYSSDYYSVPNRRAQYYQSYVCLSIRQHISETGCPTFTDVHIASGHGLVAWQYVMYFRFRMTSYLFISGQAKGDSSSASTENYSPESSTGTRAESDVYDFFVCTVATMPAFAGCLFHPVCCCGMLSISVNRYTLVVHSLSMVDWSHIVAYFATSGLSVGCMVTKLARMDARRSLLIFYRAALAGLLCIQSLSWT